MADLLSLYNSSTSATVTNARALGTSDGRQGVNFFDGTGRGPYGPTSEGTPDVWQGEFRENKEGVKVTPAATNNGTYPLSRWKADSLKIAFDGVGPIQRPKGYWLDVRFNTFKDSAGRTIGDGKLHKYAPVTGKQFAGTGSERGLNTSADARVKSSPMSTTVRGLQG